MVYSYLLTYKDYLAAQRLYVQGTLKTRWSFWFSQRIIPVLGVLSLSVLIWDGIFHHARLRPTQTTMLAMVAWLGIFFLVMRPIQLRRAFRDLRPAFGNPVELEIRDGYLISRVPGKSEGRFLPPAVMRIQQDAQVVLLYVTPKRFLFIPRRALPAEGWSALEAWHAQRGENAD